MQAKVVCFGETLWDLFPDKKVIGGAPLNVALRLHSLGAQVRIISSIGNDTDGKNLMTYLVEQKLDTDGIQISDNLATGNVKVHLDENNTATYTISEPVAWDEINVNPNDLEHVSKADAFIFGSLACRNSKTKNTLVQYLKKASYKVFDANLRSPFYHMDSIIEFMHESNLIKLNDEELAEILAYLNISINGMEAQIKFLSEFTGSDQICITLGPEGAILYTNSIFYKNDGYKVIVKDTVGAGDSFLASLIYQLKQGTEPQLALDFSCAMGSLVASKNGATAKVTDAEIQAIQLSKS